jgi:4-amino-4-deoxy-L-arabinose transferase-like glycosyltransferase
VTAALGIGGAVLLAMICVSWYGAVTLPSDARVPIHFGVSYNNFVPKRVGLVLHPAAGALVFLISTFAQRAHLANGTPPKPHPLHYVILPVILCVLLVVQIGAIRLARHNAGVRSGPPAGSRWQH